MKNRLPLIAPLACSVLLVACGGGGGGSSSFTPVPSTAAFDLRSAYVTDLITPATRSFTVSGTMSGLAVTGSGTTTTSGTSAGTFEGAAALQRLTTISGSVTVGGMVASESSSETTWTDTNYVPKGFSGDEYTVVSGTPTIPTAAHVGDVGVILNASRYADSTKAVPVGTLKVTYSLAADTTSTAILTLTNEQKNTASVTTSTIVSQYRIGTSNVMTPIRESQSDTLANSNLTLTY